MIYLLVKKSLLLLWKKSAVFAHHLVKNMHFFACPLVMLGSFILVQRQDIGVLLFYALHQLIC